MNKLRIEKDIVVKRIEGIEGEIASLKQLGNQSLEEFTNGNGWKLAQFHLHRALEGVFNISSHILSRIPGAVATQYREIGQRMGEFGIVPKEFANDKLVKMAKYRNRLVHFYSEVTPEELHKVIEEDLGDFDVFLSAIKDVLNDPQRYNLKVE